MPNLTAEGFQFLPVKFTTDLPVLLSIALLNSLDQGRVKVDSFDGRESWNI
jgi:hypothetical protein